MKQARIVALSMLVLWTPAALAHTFGAHGAGFMQGLVHPFTGLDHLLAMTAVGIWAAQQGGRALWAVPTAFVLTMIVGALVAIAGVHLPHIEAMVAASVLVLGLLVALQSRWPLAGGTSLVALFAFFHGHAHGLEMPQATAPLLYGLGFVLATAMLHVAGIAVGRTSDRWIQTAGVFIAAAGAWFMLNAFAS